MGSVVYFWNIKVSTFTLFVFNDTRMGEYLSGHFFSVHTLY